TEPPTQTENVPFIQREIPELGKSLRSFFFSEPKADVELRKTQGEESFFSTASQSRNKCILNYQHCPIPVRPPWDYSMTKTNLEQKEKSYFENYIKHTISEQQRNDDKTSERQFTPKHVGLFEVNLNVWRQFWRTLEMSDVICLLCDITFAHLHANTELIRYNQSIREKGLVIVLTKIDLVPAQIVSEWKNYFEQKYPSIAVFPYSTKGKYAGSSLIRMNDDTEDSEISKEQKSKREQQIQNQNE
ncbi:MAG: putative 50S ribosome-binding GTPase, partial [Streblomastix strix]